MKHLPESEKRARLKLNSKAENFVSFNGRKKRFENSKASLDGREEQCVQIGWQPETRGTKTRHFRLDLPYDLMTWQHHSGVYRMGQIEGQDFFVNTQNIPVIVVPSHKI